MESIRRLHLDELRDRMFGDALRVWEQTKETEEPRSLLDALRPFCDAATNLYYTDASADNPLAYRIFNVNGSFDLDKKPDWVFGDYPDRSYIERVMLPAHDAAEEEGAPSFYRMSVKVNGRYAVWERMMLPYLDAPGEKRACLSLSRLLLIVEGVQPKSVALSARELQCLTLLTAGKAAKTIAVDLGLAQKTVENCIERLKVKLGASNVAQAVAKATLASITSANDGQPTITRDNLSPRERQCLGLLASGHSWRQAAVELGLSPKTVEKHVEALKTKLGARNATELVALGIATLAR